MSIQVNTSNDGGQTFGNPVVVALGSGNVRNVILNDKPYIAVDNNPASPYGRIYVTWTRFIFDNKGAYVEGPIFSSFSDDGKKFSTPQSISGTSTALCLNGFNAFNSGICNEDQFSTPVVGPDGTVYVSYENDQFQGAPNFRNQYLVVRSTNGGKTFTTPVQAVFPLYDGFNDYPMNVDGSQTLSKSQFRMNSAGNLVVDPTSGPGPSSTRLYISFSDNRNGGLTGDYRTVTTNVDVFVSRSDNGGSTWTSPLPALPAALSQNDQFYPWSAVDTSGVLRVSFMDRSYDPSNIQYGYTLTSSTNHGSSFTSTRVDTGLSNPNDSRFFTNGGQTNGKTTFIGDYNGLAIGDDGVSHPIWTDMRTNAFPNPPPGRGHNTQDIVTTQPDPPAPKHSLPIFYHQLSQARRHMRASFSLFL